MKSVAGRRSRFRSKRRSRWAARHRDALHRSASEGPDGTRTYRGTERPRLASKQALKAETNTFHIRRHGESMQLSAPQTGESSERSRRRWRLQHWRRPSTFNGCAKRRRRVAAAEANLTWVPLRSPIRSPYRTRTMVSAARQAAEYNSNGKPATERRRKEDSSGTKERPEILMSQTKQP